MGSFIILNLTNLKWYIKMTSSYAPGPRSNRDSFFEKMKKKPDVQAVLDNLDNYTVEQLSSLEGTHFPQWIRDALVRKKQGMTKSDILARITAIAEQMNQSSNTQPILPDITPVIDYEQQAAPYSAGKKITAADFAETQRPNGTIFDSATQGAHEPIPGFEEHMRKVREKQRK